MTAIAPTATATPSVVATTFDEGPAPRRTAKPAPTPPPTATATATATTGGGTIVRDPGF
jgi:hypothetical protein